MRKIKITLDENVTTGYHWTMNGLLGQHIANQEAIDQELVGAAGTVEFEIEVREEEDMLYRFVYAQPWPGGSIAEDFTLETRNYYG